MSPSILPRLATSVAAFFLASILFPAAAADNVQNDVVAAGNGTVAAGAATTVNYRITANNGDGQNGCNAADATPATLTINAPSPVVATPGSLSFSACAVSGTPNAQPVSFSSPVAGNYSITVTVSDSGAGGYNPNPAAFTLRVLAPADTGLPSIEWSVSPDVDGWYNLASGAPTISFTCSDATSAIVFCSPPETLGQGAGQMVTGLARDAVGNERSIEVGPFDVDLTAPSISASLSHGPAESGWYNLAIGAPTAHFECADGLSGIASCPEDDAVDEGQDQSATGIAYDVAGNSASASTDPVDIDLTPPSISADLPQEGWYNLDDSPSASFQCSDALSGLASCPAAQPLLDEGEGQTVDGTAYDVAGNSASATAGPFAIDLTVPAIVASISPELPESGWYNIASGAPMVHFECSDALSGVASCSEDEELGEGEDQSATGLAEDVAGNSNSTSSDPVDIDLTAPSISASLSPDPAESGWYNMATGAPTAHFECSDALSGVAACSPDEELGEGEAQSAEGSAQDAAGNGASASSDAVDVDLTAPVLTLPASFSVFATSVGGGPASFNVSALDNLDSSPDVSCSAVSGSAFPLGSTVVECEAVDDAGNSAEGSFTVTVRFNAAGFYQPVKENKLNVVKAGSTVPLKFAIRTPGGGNIGDLSAVSAFTTQAVVCTPMLSDPIQFTTTGGTSLRYDATAGQFIQNWKTPTTKGCVRTTVTLADGSQLSALFQLK
ncbi:MAG: PxKF domain-containing protein [Thermoplasmatota archaeon]